MPRTKFQNDSSVTVPSKTDIFAKMSVATSMSATVAGATPRNSPFTTGLARHFSSERSARTMRKNDGSSSPAVATNDPPGPARR